MIMSVIALVGIFALLFSFPSSPVHAAGRKTAIFAGGCFWCMEPPFRQLEGVIDVTSGYTGGRVENPTYGEVSSGATGHYEAVRVVYNPDLTGYDQLLDVFWRQIDPTDAGGQFADRGTQYRTAIFYLDEEQRLLAEASKKKLQESGIFEKPIVTAILPAVPFYEAEEYHQDYAQKNVLHYSRYKTGSGREGFVKKTWQEAKADESSTGSGYVRPSDDELRKILTPLQYKITRKEGTEPPFNNEYWDNKQPGIYVDILSGEPLFLSKDKFDSGTGWPSFTRPVVADNIIEKKDYRLFSVRTEVRSRLADSHLGHVFNDGPPPTGLRYCINSAALRFVPLEKMEEEGYGEFVKLVDGKQ
jgi:peptide methionine sulfoxide reductase msrA/msrB